VLVAGPAKNMKHVRRGAQHEAGWADEMERCSRWVRSPSRRSKEGRSVWTLIPTHLVPVRRNGLDEALTGNRVTTGQLLERLSRGANTSRFRAVACSPVTGVRRWFPAETHW